MMTSVNMHLNAPEYPKCIPRSTERVRALGALSYYAFLDPIKTTVGAHLLVPRTKNLVSRFLPN